MAYRTSSLFHYTKDLDTLKSILKEGICPNYCKEEYPSQNQCMIIGIPMVSFCDIPLKQTAVFRERYGNFAIGLDKEWGIRNGINPILYVANTNIFNSVSLVESYKRILQEENAKNGGDSQGITLNLKPGPIPELVTFIRMQQMNYASLYLLGFLKPYFIPRNGITQCNYEENEWRYILLEHEDIPWWWNEKDYMAWRGNGNKPAASEKMKEAGLKFSLEDIRWILIPDDESKKELIEHIMSRSTLCGSELSDNDKAVICSRIMSFEAIELDV